MIIFIIISSSILILLIIYLIIGFILHYFFCSRKHLNKIKSNFGEKDPNFACQEDTTWFNEKNYKIVSISSYDKKNLKGYLFKHEKNNHLYFIYAHGWLGDPSEKTVVLKRLFKDLNANILIMEQRGQNNSQIAHISWGSAEGKDIISWSQWITNQDSDAKIILYGQSMGAASIMYSMSFGNTNSTIAAIEDCGYLSIKKQFIATATPVVGSVVSHLFTPSICIALWLTGTSFFKHNPLNGIKKNTIPFLSIHGDADELVPYSNFLEIKEKVNKNCYFESESFKNAKHGCCFVVDKEKYISSIEKFVKTALENR